MTKNIEELSTNELLELASQGREVDFTPKKKCNLTDFIKFFNIQEGVTKIPNFKIYYDYRTKWNPTGKKLSKVEFFRRFAKIFRQVRHGKVRFYLLNDCFDISMEAIKEAKEYDKRSQAIKKGIREKEKQKRQG